MISIRWIHCKLCQYIHDEQYISLKLFPITSTRNSGIAQFMICWTEQFQKKKCAPKKHNTKATKRKLQCICKSRNTFPSSVLFCKRDLYLRILLSISSAITHNFASCHWQIPRKKLPEVIWWNITFKIKC